MKKAWLVAVAVAVVGAGTVVGVSAVAGASPGGVRWGPCPSDATAPGLECATIQVPLDYRDPGGKKIDVAISRLASKNPAQRHGVLLTNPGGPSPGLTFPAELAAAKLPQSVLDSYDLIGFDPRGLGHSTPVTCGLTEEQKAAGNVPPYARDTADVAKRVEQSKAIARQCATSGTAWMLPHTSAANTARDMDSIREALGERTISFAGYSWGTYLGSVYTTLFPERSDRIMLDSSMHADGWDYANDRLYAEGFEDRFPDFAKFAAAQDATYHLGTTPKQVTAKYFDLAARLDKTPAQEVDGPAFRSVTYLFLFRDAAFPVLAQLWQALDSGRPLPSLPIVGDGSGADNLISGRYYMFCGETRWPRWEGTYQAAVALDRLHHPMFGAAAANVQPCAYWPSRTEQVRIGDRGPSNVLMLQNQRDPVTPLAGAEDLKRAFGDRARMVTVDAGGHGVYPYDANQCADTAATEFLTTGRRPGHDLACGAEG